MAVLTVPMTLVQAAKQGDKVAFMSLLEPSLEPGYRLACGMLHDSQAAEDVVQKAAFKAWRKLGQLREGHGLRPWPSRSWPSLRMSAGLSGARAGGRY